MGKKVTLLNLYGPSSGDNDTFFENICTLLDHFSDNPIIIGGDFNCTLNHLNDTKNYTTVNNRPRMRLKINELMGRHNLIDIFRSRYPDKKAFTWRKFNTNKQARLDYFLVSEELSDEISNIEIKSKYKSDHSTVVLSFNHSNFIRDRTF